MQKSTRNGFLIFFFITTFCSAKGAFCETKTVPTMTILHTTGKVIIDGNLKEWNGNYKVGPFSFDEEVAEVYNAIVYAMWDDENLYLASEIRDPNPLLNIQIPGQSSWNGDAIIIRMSSDPTLMVPLAVKKSSALFIALCWHNHKKDKDYIEACYSVEDNIMLEDYTGCEIKFKPHDDETGYTMEVKIPWKVINPKFHPKAGDRIAFTWEVSLSDANPSDPKRAFQIFLNGGSAGAFRNPEEWGVAVFKGN